MFERMGDRKDVIEFIKEVEKHPCIYNVTMPEYSNRNETKKAWRKIAERMESTVPECKEKWRKLRIAFMRSLKQMKTTNQNKPYYLYDYLSFILPYIKIGDQQMDNEETVMTVSSYSDDEVVDTLETKNNNKIEIQSEDDSRNETNGHIVYVNDRVERSHNEPYAERQREVIDRKRKKAEDVEISPRKMFLLSLLPDVESFSEDEMRAFRRNVVSCIDDIIDSRKRRNERY